MQRLIIFFIAILLTGSLGAYAHWCEQRDPVRYLSDLRSHLALDQGRPSARGNLLGIQPELVTSDYQSVARLRLKLAAYLDHARDLGLLNARTVVVLPEHIGTWLLAVGEKDELYQAQDRQQALRWLAASNPLAFSKALLTAQGESRLQDALLRTKAKTMARDYQQLFGGLARDYGVTLVAGSIVLPEPRVEHGQLKVTTGPLYNVSLVFDKAGNPLGQPQRQTHGEQAVASAPASRLQVLETPAGRLGVLLGNDAHDAQHHHLLAEQQAELLALPASEQASAEQAQALAGRLQQHGLRAAIAVQLRGRLWSHNMQPRSLAVEPGQPLYGDAHSGAQLINVWL
ncbi:Nitrilase/cyanide hydratase and apolipoprotein N-acyltransferase [Pseudomonas sp. 8Z]|uniref:carbon-nitrogen hydrolase family protein n=1 Tax=Pseudomonas sp. 8Z TaxID=2653166 RepID=UPI0012F0D328|nr:carbon-nitrogen hydrolase family protein [Pseudomonas sp. 8Z]VXC28874.1 Nitrilase/cyanide hydratase and apolipoprotein N-acyltransferase [Pseudomonas sp. 8Z]